MRCKDRTPKGGHADEDVLLVSHIVVGNFLALFKGFPPGDWQVPWEIGTPPQWSGIAQTSTSGWWSRWVVCLLLVLDDGHGLQGHVYIMWTRLMSLLPWELSRAMLLPSQYLCVREKSPCSHMDSRDGEVFKGGSSNSLNIYPLRKPWIRKGQNTKRWRSCKMELIDFGAKMFEVLLSIFHNMHFHEV